MTTPSPKSPPKQPPPSLLGKAWPWVLRFLGVGILLWETLVEKADRPALLVIAVGLALGPEFVKLDLLRRDK